MRTKAIKLLEEIIGVSVYDLELSKALLNKISKSQATITTTEIDKLDNTKIKSYYASKNTHETERQHLIKENFYKTHVW